MGAALSFWLGISGLALDFVGAAFLAYDVLFGPKARLQVSIRSVQLAIAREKQELAERSLREASASVDDTPAETFRRLREEVLALTSAADEIDAELRYWEGHERRARMKAFMGLLLLMGGFVTQAAGSLLLGREFY